MFAFCGIAALIGFVYIRPQEFIPVLARAPLLYLFVALAAFGLAVDIRLRVTRFRLPPHTPWVAGFLVWAIVTVAIYAPTSLITISLDLLIPITVFALLSLGIQSLRAFRWVAWLLVILSFHFGAHRCASRPIADGLRSGRHGECQRSDSGHPRRPLVQ